MFHLLQSVRFQFEFIWKNLVSYKYIDGIESSIFSSFFGHSGYSPLILHQNSTNGSISKFSCNVESQIISVFFGFILSYIGLPCTFKGSFTQACFGSFRKYCYIELLSFLSNIDSFYRMIFLKITFVNITTDLIRKLYVLGSF